MSIQRIKPSARMSAAVVHGGTVYLAGQVASATLEQGVAEQTREILALIDQLLAEAR
jgi:enamine deaminase RidA (YjgF/YER057c/UK114 family)